jgi:5'-nucleotidase
VRILLTNDDGIRGKGLWVVRKHLQKIADVITVAPKNEQSGASHSLTLQRPLRAEEIEPGVFTVDGTPVDAVLLALDDLLEWKPDLVVSGINVGPNLGEDVFYSGTVAGAFEGFMYHSDAIAVSLAGLDESRHEECAIWLVDYIQKITQSKCDGCSLININYPVCDEIKGTKITRLGRRHYIEIVEKRYDPRNEPYYWIAGRPKALDDSEGTDIWAIKNCYISVTPLNSDLTDYKNLDKLEQWHKNQ